MDKDKKEDDTYNLENERTDCYVPVFLHSTIKPFQAKGCKQDLGTENNKECPVIRKLRDAENGDNEQQI